MTDLHPRWKNVYQGREMIYMPRPGTGIAERRGQHVTVVRGPNPTAKNPSVRVLFRDGAQATVSPTMLERIERDVYRASEPPAPDPILDDLRDRPSYRTLLRRCEDALTIERDQGPDAAIGLRAAATDQARRSVRSALSGAALDVQGATTERLLQAAYQEVQTRVLNRAGRIRIPGAAPERPATLIRMTQAAVTQFQRVEHNLIAAAILNGDVTPDERPQRLQPPLPGQPRKHPLADEHEQAWREMHQHAMLCVRHTLGRNTALADHHAALSEDARVRHEVLAAELERRRATHHTGRYHDGELFRVALPADPTLPEDLDLEQVEEWQNWHFTLVIVWAEDGATLEVANGVEIEQESGVYVGEDGWRALTRWLETHDDRLTQGAQQGRQFEDETDLIWRVNGSGLSLRTKVAQEYPAIVHALEAIRCLLRPEVA